MELDEFGQGKCVNCGLLGKRELYGNNIKIFEVAPVERQTGRIDTVTYLITPHPYCFTRKRIFDTETNDPARVSKTKQAIQECTKCESWYQYTPGLSPKEHYQEKQMYALEQMKLEFARKAEADQRAIDAANSRNNKLVIVFTVVMVVLAIFQLQIDDRTVLSHLVKWIVERFQ